MTSTAVDSIVLTLHAYPEDGQWVAECVQLDVASCGDTIDEAFKAVTEAVTLYLNTLEDVGERQRVFKERGITMNQNGAEERVPVLTHHVVTRQPFDVPQAAV